MSVSFRPVSYVRFGNQKSDQKTEEQFPQRFALFSDIDNSAIDWTPTDGQPYNRPALQQLSRVLRRDEFKQDLLRGLTTGRGPHSFKNLSDNLGLLPPLHMTMLNDGQILFLNEKGMPNRQWIQSLRLEQQDPEWKDYLLQEKNWEITKVIGTIQKLLDEEGYKPHPDAVNRQRHDEPDRTITYRPMTQKEINASFEHPEQLKAKGEKPVIVLARYPDQSYFEIRIEDTTLPADIDPVSQKLSERILAQLKAKGIKADGYAYSLHNHAHAFSDEDRLNYNRAYIHYGPEGIDKSSAIQEFIKKRMTHLNAFMTAGDSRNDINLLSMDSVSLPETGNSALNYPIRLGNHPALDGLTGLSRLIRVPMGRLAEGISRQWEKMTHSQPEETERFQKLA